MKAIFTMFFIVAFSLSGCKKEHTPGLLDGPWTITSKGELTLYTRPAGYSREASPDDTAIRQTLDNQLLFIDIINQKLGVNYNSGVSIYFYNKDEVKAKLGVEAGGSSNTEQKEIYYSYYLNQYYPNYQLNDYLGVHEMVHIVSINTLGMPGTIMMAEGYAVAIDGTLGATDSSGKTRKRLEDWMPEFRANNQLVTPTQLLMNFDSLSEKQSYAQSGYFVNWLFNEFGITKINQLFTSKKENFKDDFYRVTGVRFDEMEKEYIEKVR